ncbi:MAG: TatD family hydrolase [Desulfatitalea sp.]|nr:TatD family hydrolase [Desulfatitalea sp.]
MGQRFPGQVWPAIGYHPWSLAAEEVAATQIRSHLSRCVALGEVGLDYKVKVSKTLQHEVFLFIRRTRNRNPHHSPPSGPWP